MLVSLNANLDSSAVLVKKMYDNEIIVLISVIDFGGSYAFFKLPLHTVPTSVDLVTCAILNVGNVSASVNSVSDNGIEVKFASSQKTYEGKPCRIRCILHY